MFERLREFVQQSLSPQEAVADTDTAVQLATAALMLEMAHADFSAEDSEFALIRRLLKEHFQLAAAELDALMERAGRRQQDSVSLHSFTHQLHEYLEPAEKDEILEMLWEVAYADGKLDRYEDNLVRKVADLLYVRHGDLIRVRNRVRDRQRHRTRA